MKTLLFLLLLVAGFATTGSGQITVKNNLNCPIVVEVTCHSAPCGGWVPIACGPYTIAPGQLLNLPGCPLCTNGLIGLVLHFYFPPSGGMSCSTFDPFVAAPGNCMGLPKDDVMTGPCDCKSGKVRWLNGANWEVNP